MRTREALAALPIFWRTFGVRGLRERGIFELRRRTGRFRVSPGSVSPLVATAPLPSDWPFVPDRERVRATADRVTGIARADRVLAGEHQAFRWTWMPRPQRDVEWRTHPASGFEYDAAVPWFSVAHFNTQAGDIKDVWEAGRFAWCYDLAKGHLLTGDDSYAECFWRGFESFIEGCPPFSGVQWSCGQETAIRATAWLWAEGAMLDAPSSTSERLGLLRNALVWSAQRVADAIGYAISQRNNHGLSEATALVAIGARFHGAEPSARKWFRDGVRWLEKLIPDQIADDGWYIQHSINYLRLALDQLVTAERALRSRGGGLSPASTERVRSAIRLLGYLIDPASGAPPLYGANDGAYVLPLSTRPYRDFVPSLTAAAATFAAPLPRELAPDAEMLAWLGLAEPKRDDSAPLPGLHVGSSRWFMAVTSGARVFGRAPVYRSRPGHIDPLHVDISLGGRPVASDAGTFRYAAPAPWANGLAEIDVHNTLTIVGLPPARRGPRFLWLTWPTARVVEATIIHDELVRVVMENTSWSAHGILHRRTCEIHGGGVTIVDEVTSPPDRPTQVSLQWLIDGPATELSLNCSSPITVDETRAAEQNVRGWISEGYAAKRGATSVRVSAHLQAGRLRIVSAFGEQRVQRRTPSSLNEAAAQAEAYLPRKAHL